MSISLAPWHAGPALSKHTLNKWRVEGADGLTVVEVFNSEADARLIAAAPEMYDAICQWLHAWETDDEIEEGIGFRSMCAAIAKAEGREP